MSLVGSLGHSLDTCVSVATREAGDTTVCPWLWSALTPVHVIVVRPDRPSGVPHTGSDHVTLYGTPEATGTNWLPVSRVPDSLRM